MVESELSAQGSPKISIKAWELVVASCVGSFFVAIADLLVNGPEAVTTRVGTIVARVLGTIADYISADTLSFLVMAALGLGLCFVYRPTTRPGAFGRGSSVIAVLAVMNTGATAFVTPANSETMRVSPTVQVSTCKPRIYGPFGLGTMLRGDAKACWTSGLVNAPMDLTCTDSITVGNARYCSVKLPDGQTVWVKK